MLAWVALAAFLLPLIHFLLKRKNVKHERKRKLELIQRRLAQKEQRSTGEAGTDEKE